MGLPGGAWDPHVRPRPWRARTRPPRPRRYRPPRPRGFRHPRVGAEGLDGGLKATHHIGTRRTFHTLPPRMGTTRGGMEVGGWGGRVAARGRLHPQSLGLSLINAAGLPQSIEACSFHATLTFRRGRASSSARPQCPRLLATGTDTSATSSAGGSTLSTAGTDPRDPRDLVSLFIKCLALEQTPKKVLRVHRAACDPISSRALILVPMI